jgi:hypothetical protein
MMPSSSQVHDHRLIFQIISGVGQFHYWQKREERRRGELAKKLLLPKHRGEEKVAKKVAAASQT